MRRRRRAAAAGIAMLFASITTMGRQVQTPPAGRGSLTEGNGSIGGIVRGESGQPLAGVVVRAIDRFAPPTTREVRYLIRATTRTNAQGEYRIDRLGGADYVVDVPLTQITMPLAVADRYATNRTTPTGAALFQRLSDSLSPLPAVEGTRVDAFLILTRGPFAEAPRPRPPTAESVFVYAPRFFPSASTTADAQVISLGPGEHFQADLTLPAVRGRRVSGRLQGRPDEIAHLGVRLLPEEDELELFREGDFELAATATDDRGAFTFMGVPAGRYSLKVLFVPSQLPGAAAAARVGPRSAVTAEAMEYVRWSEVTLTVGDTDVLGLELPLRQPVRVSGRIDLGLKAASPPEASIALLHNRPVTIPPPAPVPINPDGSYAVRLYGPGLYTPVVSGIAGWQVQSVAMSGRSLPNRQVRVPAEGLQGVTIAMTAMPGPSGAAPLPGRGNAPPPPSPENGFIAGRVIDGVTSLPVRGARVSAMIANDPSTRRVVTTDDAGSFSFGDAVAGSYSITADAAGYTPGTFGRLRPDGEPSNLGLAARERVGAMVIRVWKFGHVTGRVTDDAGRPVSNVIVTPLFVSRRGTSRTFSARSFARTNVNGIYRVENLFPGDHVVCASFTATTIPTSVVDAARRGGSAGNPDAASRLAASRAPRISPEGVAIETMRFSMTGFGGLTALPAPVPATGEIVSYRFACHGPSASLEEAGIVRVSAGEERPAVDLRLSSGSTTTVAGTVRGPSGAMGFFGLRLLPERGPGIVMGNDHFPVAATASDATGAFTFLGVPPGRYLLRAFTSRSDDGPSDSNPATPGLFGTGVTLWSEQVVVVPPAGLTGVDVTLGPAARINGRVVFDGTGTPPPSAQLQVQLAGRPVLDPPMPGPARVRADGTFTLQGHSPASYVLYVTNGGAWGMGSVAIDGIAVPARRLVVGTKDLSGVELTLTDRFSELSGRVAPLGSSPIGVTVLIFPADYRRWIADDLSPVQMRSFRPSGSWTYRVPWLPAGEYFVVAYPEVDGSDLTVEFIERLAKLASRVTIGEGEKKALDLTVTSIR